MLLTILPFQLYVTLLEQRGCRKTLGKRHTCASLFVVPPVSLLSSPDACGQLRHPSRCHAEIDFRVTSKGEGGDEEAWWNDEPTKCYITTRWLCYPHYHPFRPLPTHTFFFFNVIAVCTTVCSLLHLPPCAHFYLPLPGDLVCAEASLQWQSEPLLWQTPLTGLVIAAWLHASHTRAHTSTKGGVQALH